jgi:catechol 2,3-dioxygenase-like lactoylglutathione lyase family enzyme
VPVIAWAFGDYRWKGSKRHQDNCAVQRRCYNRPNMFTKALLGISIFAFAAAAQSELPAPGFHHLHLLSTNPEAAIDYYVKAFPSTAKDSFAGKPALRAGKVLVLFDRVGKPPLLRPQTAIWHYGWNVTDERATQKRFHEMPGVKILPLYTGEGDNFVEISSDSWPGGGGPGGALGRTKSQIEDAKAKGIKPLGGAGFGYIAAPDGAMVEFAGNSPAERFNHVHMYQDDVFCAQIWYQTHLNAPQSGRGPQHTTADCKETRGPEKSWPGLLKDGMFRVPSAGVTFDDVALNWYANQGDESLASTQGHQADHFALSVADLDAWTAKLKKENVTFLKQVYRVGGLRAVMIQGPSHEVIELVEVK